MVCHPCSDASTPNRPPVITRPQFSDQSCSEPDPCYVPICSHADGLGHEPSWAGFRMPVLAGLGVLKWHQRRADGPNSSKKTERLRS